MNILFISNIATPYQLDMLKKINSCDNTTIFGYFLYSKEANRKWDLDLPIYIHIANYSKKLSDYVALYKFIKNNQIDKIIIGGYSLPMTFFITILSKISDLNIYFWLERPINEQSGLKYYLKEIYLKIILSKAKKIFAIGKLAVERYSQYHSRVINLPYNMYLDKFYNIQREKNSSKKINFLFSGQYINRKNIINTIKAFKSINNENIVLNLIGGGELQGEVSALIKDDKRIHDIGFVQPSDLVSIYEENDIFLMPSKHDGWALVINEAMASSMPVISTDKVGAVVEYIKHKENGFVTSTKVDSIREGIEFYLENQNYIFAHGIKNKNIIKKSNADVNNASEFLLENLQ